MVRLWLVVLVVVAFFFWKVGGSTTTKVFWLNDEHPADLRADYPLDKHFVFRENPLLTKPPRSLSSHYFEDELSALIARYGFWDSTGSYQVGNHTFHRPSYGCHLKPFSQWFEKAPSTSLAMCNINTVLFYSEQRSGTSLLHDALNSIPSVYSFHELYCCEHPPCENQTVGITTYSQLACAYQLDKKGVNTVVVNLQWNHFWGPKFKTAIEYPTQQKLPVIILQRQNYISHYLAGNAFHSNNPSHMFKNKTRVDTKRIKLIPKKAKLKRERYLKLYCSLQRNNVPVLLITYEDLLEHRKETMDKVTQFLGVKSWNGPTDTRSHIKLSDRIENYERLLQYMKDHSGLKAFTCYLEENCDWPPMGDCPENLDTLRAEKR